MENPVVHVQELCLGTQMVQNQLCHSQRVCGASFRGSSKVFVDVMAELHLQVRQRMEREMIDEYAVKIVAEASGKRTHSRAFISVKHEVDCLPILTPH